MTIKAELEISEDMAARLEEYLDVNCLNPEKWYKKIFFWAICCAFDKDDMQRKVNTRFKYPPAPKS